ncbi:ankyrin, partial [Amniculicola lignicola CBS 123094]
MDPWTNALHQFQDALSPQEKIIYAISKPQDVLQDVINREQAHRKSSRLRNLSTKIKPFLDVLEDYGKSLDVLANTSSVLPPLWGALRVLLLAAQRFNDYFCKLIDMFERISDIIPRFSTYAKILPHHTPLRNALSAAYLEILQFITRAKSVFPKSSFRVLMATTWKSFDRTFESSVSNIRRYRELVEDEARLAAMLDQLQENKSAREERDRAAECRAKIEKLETIARRQNTDEGKRWLRARKCSEEKDLVDESSIKGTCEWILQRDETTHWLKEPQHQILWLQGQPGCGKSYIYAHFIKHLDTQQPTMYFLFCGGDKERVTVPALLRSWCAQILEAFPQTTEYLDTFKELNGNPTATDKEIMELFKLLLGKIQPCYLTVDALDECSEPDQFFKFLSFIPRQFKIFITSRTPAGIRKGFSKLRTSVVTLDIKPEYYKADIDQFIDQRFDDFEIDYNEEVKRKIRDRLRDCDGMFLWVKLMFDHLQAQTCASEVLGCLEELPEGLSQTYDRTLESVNSLPQNRRLLAFKVFFWVLIMRRPITVAEVRVLLAVQPKYDAFDENRLIQNADAAILSACGGMLHYRGASQKLFFAHFTVTEYLEQYFQREHTLQEILTCYESQELQSNESLAATVCMQYLSYDFIAQLRVPKDCGQAREILDNQEPHRALLEYAISNWFHHVNSIPSPEPTVVQLAVHFLTHRSANRMACWQLYWFSGPDSFESSLCPGQFSGLHIAAYFGLECMVKGLFALEPQETKDTLERSPLWWAASRGHAGITKLLMEAGMDPCAPDAYSMTPAHQAAAGGYVDAFREILSVSGDPALLVQDAEQWTPLHMAASRGHKTITELSMMHFYQNEDKSPAISRCKLGRIPLHLASLNGFSSLLDSLIYPKHRSSILNCQDINGFSPLHLSAMQGHVQCAQYLSANDTDMTLLDTSGRTALKQAEAMGNHDVAAIIRLNQESALRKSPRDMSQLALVSRNLAKFDLKFSSPHISTEDKAPENNSRDGQDASVFASIVNGHTSFMQLLGKKSRPLLSRMDHRGRSGLHHTAALGYENCVVEIVTEIEMLSSFYVRRPPSPTNVDRTGSRHLCDDSEDFLNLQDDLGNTALHYAAAGNFHAIVKLLLNAGASGSLINTHSLSAYAIAHEGGHKTTLETLARYARLPTNDIKEDLGFGVWHVAARNGTVKEDEVKVADIVSLSGKDDLGRTPLYRATESNHTETSKLIYSYTEPAFLELLELSQVAEENDNVDLLHYYLHQLGPQSLAHDPPHEAALQLLTALIRRHDCTALDILFDAGLSPNCANPTQFGIGNNALHYAFHNEDFDVRRRNATLYGPYVDPDHRGTNGSSTLIYLIQRGVNLTNIDQKGTSAMDLACLHRLPEVVECLLEHGAEVDAMIKPQASYQCAQTPLHDVLSRFSWSAQQACRLADLLLNHGADPFLGNKEGEYPVWRVVKEWRLYGNIPSRVTDLAVLGDLFHKHNLSYLLQEVNESGFQRIHLAAAVNDLYTLEEELENGFPVDWPSFGSGGVGYGEKFFSPLEIVVGCGHVQATRFLVERGADVGRVRVQVGEWSSDGVAREGVVGETRG